MDDTLCHSCKKETQQLFTFNEVTGVHMVVKRDQDTGRNYETKEATIGKVRKLCYPCLKQACQDYKRETVLSI